MDLSRVLKLIHAQAWPLEITHLNESGLFCVHSVAYPPSLPWIKIGTADQWRRIVDLRGLHI